jgi:hypothetical protein
LDWNKDSLSILEELIEKAIYLVKNGKSMFTTFCGVNLKKIIVNKTGVFEVDDDNKVERDQFVTTTIFKRLYKEKNLIASMKIGKDLRIN